MYKQIGGGSLCSVVLGHFHEGNGDHYVCLDADRDGIQEIVAASDQLSTVTTSSQIVPILSTLEWNTAHSLR